jgi:hypothetical protein
MSNLIATKRVDLLAPYLALDQGPRVQAECEYLYCLPAFHAFRGNPYRILNSAPSSNSRLASLALLYHAPPSLGHLTAVIATFVAAPFFRLLCRGFAVAWNRSWLP